jgi:hypothetical protein
MKQAWWETRWFAVALIALSVVPVLYPDFPPLVDLPSHMGRYKIAMGDSAYLARYFEFRWQLSGNLGADLLVVPLSWLLGPVAATKIVATLIPPLVVGAVLAISKQAHGQLSPTAAMAVPLVYTQPFLFGLLNYMLAVALALWIYYWFVRLGDAGRMRLRSILLLPAGFLLFLTHISGWGILGLILFAAELVRQRGQGKPLIKAAVASAGQMLPLIIPLLLLFVWQSSAAGKTEYWFHWKLKLLWSGTLFRDSWRWVDVLTLAAVYLLLSILLIGRSFRLDRALGLGAFLVFAAFVVLPFIIFGSSLSDVRLLPVSLMLVFAALRPFDAGHRRLATITAMAAAIIVVLRMATVTFSFAQASDRQAAQLTLLDQVERGSRVAVAVGGHCSPWPLPRSDHLGSMAIVRREAFVNDQWYLPGSVSLTVRYPAAGRYAADPSQFLPAGQCGPEALANWMGGLPSPAFDFVWLLETGPMPAAFAHEWRLVAEAPGSRLYRKTENLSRGANQHPALSPQEAAQQRNGGEDAAKAG